ncbi:hypothetical protein Hanom_Chr09g00853581 [Helianthus anomalus]
MLLSFSFSFPVSSIGTMISPVTVFLHLFTKTLPLNLKESSNIRLKLQGPWTRNGKGFMKIRKSLSHVRF